MSKGNCPSWGSKIRMNNSLVRCPKCGNTFCQDCGKGALVGNKKCPAYGTKGSKI